MTLCWVALTLVAYRVALEVHRRGGSHPAANPMLIAVALVGAVLWATGTPYRTYFDGVRLVHALVGPATVALAIPLHAQIARLGTMAVPLSIALAVGSLTATASAVAIGWACGAPREVLLALAPKSITMPIALGVAERLGAAASLTALTVTLTGIAGAVMADRLLGLTGTHERAVRGFCLGLTSHAIGTAHVLREGEVAAGFAALAMGLNGLATALWLPLVAALFR